jgi:hypothetical protein
MVLLARYELIQETEVAVEYQFGDPEMDRRLVIRKRDRNCSATGGMDDPTVQTLAGKILWEQRNQGSWPASGMLAT